MTTTLVLFTRDLRVHDNPALAAAVRGADAVLPLFVLDPVIRAGANRRRFLAESLSDLRESLRLRGADLIVRRGDPVRQAVRLASAVAAEQIVLAADVSGYAQRRERRLDQACRQHRIELRVHPGVTVVPAGSLRPSGGSAAYRVFTPYWRAWRAVPWRALAPTPRQISLPAGWNQDAGVLPPLHPRGAGAGAAPGGEAAGRVRLREWLGRLGGYAEGTGGRDGPVGHDLMAVDRTSRLSPYLRFGCVSGREVAGAALDTGLSAAEDFVRQLCWRDFFHQLTAVFPEIVRRPVRPVTEQWRVDESALASWRSGHTGVPIIDAGMRQLMDEGWMHNRARLLVASFLTKELGLDWRSGARWFDQWLVDGDVPDNYGNWQWVAGTGSDTRPHRRFNPIRQAYRYDPQGDYVRRYLPELAGVAGKAVHEPWRLDQAQRRGLDYPLSPSDFQSFHANG